MAFRARNLLPATGGPPAPSGVHGPVRLGRGIPRSAGHDLNPAAVERIRPVVYHLGMNGEVTRAERPSPRPDAPLLTTGSTAGAEPPR